MPKNGKQYIIGIDIGGTKMSAVLFDGVKVLADYVLATPKDNLEHFMVMANALIEPLLEKAKRDKIKVAGIGVGVAGAHDYKKEKILKSPNLPIIDGINLANRLKAKTSLPAKMDNDTNCFVRAEALLGAGKKYDNVYGVIIGTGIGGAWWVNNEVYLGSHGGAGEPGAMVVDGSGMSLEAIYDKLSQDNPGQLAEEAYRGDVLAEKAYKEIGEYLGVAFANIVNIVDPEAIIVGGGVVESSDLFLSEAKKTMREHILSPEAKKIKILKGSMGKHAGAIGAALLFG